MKKIFILLGLSTSVFISCQKILLPPVPGNNPVSNFESMWKGFDRWYGLLETRQVNWDSLYAVYRPQVNEQTTAVQLYQVLSDLIRPLNDIHVFLQPTSDGLARYESSAFFREHKVQEDFSIALIRQRYCPWLQAIDDHLHYGRIEDSIGYIHFSDFGKPLKYYEQQMSKIMNALRDTKAMIVDIRDHAGGDDRVSRYVAGWFAAEPRLFMTTRKRNGPGHGDFTAPDRWYTDRQGNYQYTQKVLLLTTRWTASAGETFAWAMNTQAHVRQLGDTTAGGFSDVISRELPNGWLYFVPVGDYRNAQGQSDEGVGIIPAIYRVNSKTDIAAGKDKVLEEAISRAK